MECKFIGIFKFQDIEFRQMQLEQCGSKIAVLVYYLVRTLPNKKGHISVWPRSLWKFEFVCKTVVARFDF